MDKKERVAAWISAACLLLIIPGAIGSFFVYSPFISIPTVALLSVIGLGIYRKNSWAGRLIDKSERASTTTAAVLGTFFLYTAGDLRRVELAQINICMLTVCGALVFLTFSLTHYVFND